MISTGLPMETVTIKGEYIELIKLLKITGLCDTGGMAQQAVMDGDVLVDGRMERRKRCKIRRGQRVEFGGRTIEVA